MSSDSDEEEVLLLIALLKRKKRKWVDNVNLKRHRYGEYHRLCKELESNEDRFYYYYRMSKDCVEEIYLAVKDDIMKLDTTFRRAIGPKERLAICLRYLTTGDSYRIIADSFRVGRSTVGCIVKNVSRAIWTNLYPKYMPTPTDDTWRQSEIGYRENWNFPNCLGCIDGKHIAIKCPPNSKNRSIEYENPDSIVLFTIIDPFNKFIIVDVGDYGDLYDTRIFEKSVLYRDILSKKLLLPSKPLPGMEECVPHVLIGNEGFVIQRFLMRPYPRAATFNDKCKMHFNDRIWQARSVVQTTFNNLTEKWRIFNRPIETNVDNIMHIVKAACCLHNYVSIKQQGPVSIESQITISNLSKALTPIRSTNLRSSVAVFKVRDTFAAYFYKDILNCDK
ncbi:uncharacterized protein LOC126879571 [Diabrotica virgifera virgifera]|uniref:Uncharacterized protein LOC114344008 n=1 Tax=Diabrotica virgifera virgifera TaxID=50390 RepID=A0A6P7H3S2_DIAVI|nr:uncharacterized protein LOC126879571 [Diabrotica virgifera virgifera]